DTDVAFHLLGANRAAAQVHGYVPFDGLHADVAVTGARLHRALAFADRNITVAGAQVHRRSAWQENLQVALHRLVPRAARIGIDSEDGARGGDLRRRLFVNAL